jgi:hypothetical protein
MISSIDTPGNDNFGSASFITTGVFGGSLSSSDRQDYFKIYLNANQTLKVSIQLSGSYTIGAYLYLYDPSQGLITSSINTAYLDCHFVSSSAGYYFIALIDQDTYGTFVYTAIVSSEDSNGNDDFSNAIYVTSGALTGSLGPTDLQDYYKIFLYQGQNISIELSVSQTTAYGPRLILYSQSQSLIISDTTGSDLYITYLAVDSGYYYIVLNSQSLSSTDYYSGAINVTGATPNPENQNPSDTVLITVIVSVAVGSIICVFLILYAVISKRKKGIEKKV